MSGPQGLLPEDSRTLQRFNLEDVMVPDDEGEWVKHEDVVLLLRYWGGYIQGHREMLEDMKLHPKIIAAVRKAEKAFNEFGND